MSETEAMDPSQEYIAKLFTCHKAIDEATERGDSEVQNFYNGATVFMTGGSGFLGKQLIEKLFRATKISKMLVLLRPKKGKQIEERLNEMLQDPVFDLVREKQPDFAEKIVPVPGDVAELRLGLSDKDWDTITEQVDIIFYGAATTRFDESLRVATIINVRGTREALALGKACKHLKSYVHISTAYSHACKNRINIPIKEDFYKSPVDPHCMIQLVETIDDERLEAITASLINNWPNTYTFAKALGEELVSTTSGDMPVCIARPTIVICAQREPHPGWLDMSTIYGASGLVIGIGLGLTHVAYVNLEAIVDLVPVDYVNNAIIVAAYETAKRNATGETKPKIYSISSTTRQPAPWRVLRRNAISVGEVYPSAKSIWLYFVWETANPILFWIYSWLLHLIPAYIIDGVCWVLGKERRFVKLYKKMYKMSDALSYFTCNQWYFEDNNTNDLYKNLSKVDQEIFYFDIESIDWEVLVTTWCLGLRKFILKDGLSGTRYAKKKQNVFKLLNCILTVLYIYLLYTIVYYIYFTVSRLFGLICL